MMILSSSRLIHASSGGIRFVHPTAEMTKQVKQQLKVATWTKTITLKFIHRNAQIVDISYTRELYLGLNVF